MQTNGRFALIWQQFGFPVSAVQSDALLQMCSVSVVVHETWRFVEHAPHTVENDWAEQFGTKPPLRTSVPQQSVPPAFPLQSLGWRQTSESTPGQVDAQAGLPVPPSSSAQHRAAPAHGPAPTGHCAGVEASPPPSPAEPPPPPADVPPPPPPAEVPPPPPPVDVPPPPPPPPPPDVPPPPPPARPPSA